MADEAAYAPKANTDLDGLGTLFVNDTTEVNVRQLVQDSQLPDGAFIVTDPAVIRVLDGYDAVKRVALHQAQEQQEKADKSERRQAKAGQKDEG